MELNLRYNTKDLMIPGAINTCQQVNKRRKETLFFSSQRIVYSKTKVSQSAGTMGVLLLFVVGAVVLV